MAVPIICYVCNAQIDVHEETCSCSLCDKNWHLTCSPDIISGTLLSLGTCSSCSSNISLSSTTSTKGIIDNSERNENRNLHSIDLLDTKKPLLNKSDLDPDTNYFSNLINESKYRSISEIANQ